MASSDSNGPMERYALSQRILHWLMAVGFILMWGCGYAMTSVVAEDSPLEEFLFSLHISVGVTLLVLLAVRIALRLLITSPRPAQGLARWEEIASRLGHLGLYVLPAAIILVGWAETDFGGYGVRWFGVAMPKIFPKMETLWGIDLEETTATLHAWFAYAMLALAVVHVVAVIKHRFFDGHDVLPRMLFGRGGQQRPE